MAGEDLYQSLGGVNFAPTETPWGIGATTLAQSTPLMISPYASTGQALGIGLGSVLLQSLLGYQAQKEAAQQSLTANTIANQMLQESDAQKRLNLIQSLEPGYYQPAMQRKLLDVQSLITSRDAANKAAAAQLGANEIAKLKAVSEFYGTPEGEAAWKRELQRTEAESLAKYAGLRPGNVQPKAPSFWESIQPTDRVKLATSKGQISAIRDLANTFEQLGGNAATFQAESKLNPQSPENLALAKLNILVPSTARLMGEVGNLAQPEQERLINATLGSVLSGPKSIAARLRQLADTAEGIIDSKTTAYKAAFETGGESMLPKQIAPQTGDEARKEQLRQQIAEIKALLAQRQK